ncbi:MAG: glycosyltransferase family 1 protein [Chloroflexota bacterium]|nr:MAG: glycosyltransferase family 1 protein [Chloroflexota bacterium]
MRILMLTDLYPPIIGGMELHVQSLSTELALRGHQVSVATLWHKASIELEYDQGVKTYRVHGSLQRMAHLFSDASRRFAPPFPDPEVTLALRRIMAKERPDVVHAHNWLSRSLIPLKPWSHTPLVLTLHDYSLSCSKKNLTYHEAICGGPELRKCLGCCIDHYGLLRALPIVLANHAMRVPERSAVDVFLPVSRAVASGNQLQSRRLPFKVVPNFLREDAAPLHGDDESYRAQLPAEEFILFVGALGRHKGIDVLLEAYAGLIKPPPLVLIGTPWVDSPTRFPPGVTVLNSWPHGPVMDAWSRCLMGVVPSTWPEPCPTVVMEAMHAARPVIGSRIGGIPDLVADGETGLLVSPCDPIALRQSIERLLVDPGLRKRMGQAGQRRIAQFMASAIVPRIERVYEELLLSDRPLTDSRIETPVRPNK